MSIVAVLAVSATGVFAAEPILKCTFASNEEGWVTMGKPGATLKVDGGALHFGYKVENPPAMSMLVHPLGEISAKGLQSVRFEVKTESAFAIAVVLSEKKPGGGNYTAAFWSTGKGWQPVVLSVADFVEGEGPNEPKDADGKLGDDLEGVGFLDISQMFSHAGPPIFTTSHDGDHTISIRNFELSREPAKPREAMAVDDFSAPQAMWIAPGAAEFKMEDGALSLSYQQQPEQAVIFVHPLAKQDYRGATHLAFDVESSKPGQFIWALAEGRNHGPEAARYNVDFTVLTPNKMDHREIVLSAFTADANGPQDPNGKLDLDNLRSLSLIDLSQQDGPNTLKLKNIRFIKK